MSRCLLAFDVGTRRIGVASGNTITCTATPLTTIDGTRVDETFAAIGRLIAQWQPDRLVVGVPRHPDGQPHAMTQHAERFARRLEGRFRLPVARVDERYSSVEAQGRGAARDELDAASAAVILEQYLDDIARRPSSEAHVEVVSR
jgi:putative Holliday junction resolvase